MLIESPLRVPAGKNDFILNLNNYRNEHYQTLNKAKIAYKQLIHNQVVKLPKMNKIIVIVVLVILIFGLIIGAKRISWWWPPIN